MKGPTVFSIFLRGILLPEIVLSKITSSLFENFCKAIENAASNTEFCETLLSLAKPSTSISKGVTKEIISSFLVLSFFSLEKM